VAEVPGVVRRPVGLRLGGRQDAELGRVGLADEHEAQLAELRGQPGVAVGAEALVSQEAHPLVLRRVLDRADQVLDDERHALERAVRRLGRQRLVEQRVDDGVELAVERLDPLYRALRQLFGRSLPGSNELGLGSGVEMRIHGPRAYWLRSQGLSK
jgi:hypothetical protein